MDVRKLDSQKTYTLDIEETREKNRALLANILYIECEGYLTTVHLVNESKICTTQRLKRYEIMLEPYGFIRIHHKIIINGMYITKIKTISATQCSVTLMQKLEFPVSKRKKKRLKSFFFNDHLLVKFDHL